MIIKSPPVYDVSHWKEIMDFSVISPRPALMITKATEGISLKDDKFIRFFEGMKRVGFQRGAFHFNRKDVNAIRQARYFCDFIRPHVTSKDYLVLDVEEGGEKASELWAWFEWVHEQFPSNRLMLYGRKDLLNPIPMTAGEREYFKKIPLWVAGYPIFPDLFTAIPKGYIPDQTKWGPVWLWQYSAHGKVNGIQGDVDLNLATPEFMPILLGDPDPTPEPEETKMKKGTVKTGFTLTVRDAAGVDTGARLRGGDVVYGSVLNGRIYFERIYRGGVTIEEQAGNASTGNATEAYMTLIDVDEPQPAPPADEIRIQINVPITATFNGRVYKKNIEIDTVLDLVE